jgi:uncharacterized membrane protein
MGNSGREIGKPSTSAASNGSAFASRRNSSRFVCRCLGVALAVTLTIFLLQGFGSRLGFHLDAPFMYWIGTATVGCVSTLAVLVYKCFFPTGGGKGRGTGRGGDST